MKKLICLLVMYFSIGASAAEEVKAFPSIPKYMYTASHRIAVTIDPKTGATGHGAGVCVNLSRYGLEGPRYLLTAAHMIIEKDKVLKTILVESSSGGKKEWIQAHVVAYDEPLDMALLWTESDMPEMAELAKTDNIDVGDAIIAIGSPRGSALSANLGYLSEKGYASLIEPHAKWFQGSMAVTHGNSGGPVFDPTHKEVCGIVTAIWEDAMGAAPNITFFVGALQINDFLGASQKTIEKFEKKKKKN